MIEIETPEEFQVRDKQRVPIAITTISDSIAALTRAWPEIVLEARAVLASELHYQAVVYHCLHMIGVPRAQLGMNVKQWVPEPRTALFQSNDLKKQADYRGGFEPIPDVVIFRPEIKGDWRRRNADATLRQMLLAVEVKASERAKARLQAGEIIRDIRKLEAHRDEVRHLGADMHPVMLVIDTAPLTHERMSREAVVQAASAAWEHGVSYLYVSPDSVEAEWSFT
jgi:hypothetical protein